MRILILLCCFCLFANNTLQAQAGKWEWAIGKAVPADVPVTGLVTDSAENIYVRDYNFSKYSPTGSLIWSKNIKANSLTIDAAGNTYLTGSFTGSLQLDSVLLTCPNWKTAVFIAKFNPAGKLQWAKKGPSGATIGPNDYPEVGAASISADSAGNTFVAGHFYGSTDFDSLHLTGPAGSINQFNFIAKYATNGKILWVRIPTNNPYMLSQVTTGPQGGYFVSDGNTFSRYTASGSLTWQVPGGLWMAVDKEGNCYGSRGFYTDSMGTRRKMRLIKYNSAGKLEWTQTSKSLDSTSTEFLYSLFAGQKQVFLTGDFTGKLTFGNKLPILSGPTVNGQAEFNGFVAGFSTKDGTPLWLKQIVAPYHAIGKAVAGLDKGGCIVSGRYYNPGCKLDSISLSVNPGNTGFFLAKNAANYLNFPSPDIPKDSAAVATSFQFFPNPAVNEVTIKAPGFENGTVLIYNPIGQKIWQAEISEKGEATIHVKDWAAGIYAVRLSANGKLLTRKLLKTTSF
jgi:hypothetical protein